MSRSALMVIVESTRATVPSSRNGIRLSEIASMKFGSTPSLISPAAWILPIVVSSGNCSASAAGVSSPPLAGSSSSSPQAATNSPSTSTRSSAQRVLFISRSPSVMDDLVHEIARTLALRRGEELRGRRLLDDPAVVDEDDPVADLAREPHLVGHDGHRHAVAREVAHDVEHLPDHLRVQRRSRLVEEHELRLHGERPRDRDALLLAAR